MLKDLITSTTELGWKSRIYISIFLCTISILIYIYFESLWVWGYLASAFLLITPLLFAEKFVEFNEETSEDLTVVSFSVDLEKLKDLLHYLHKLSLKGFDENKLNGVLSQVEKINFDEQKFFNFYIITEKVKSSVAIKIKKTTDVFTTEFTSSEDIRTLLKNYMNIS